MESTKGDNMYNEETKRRYIEYKEASNIMCDNYLYRVFEAVSSSEVNLPRPKSIDIGLGF